MIGKPIPIFALKPSVSDRPGLASADLTNGRVHLLNFFASWCVPCIVEAPQLLKLRQAGVEVVGISIRDRPEDLKLFFELHGNPFSRVGRDDVSATQFEFGASGVPESFVIDGKGVIRYQHIGDIQADHIPMILARVREAGQ